MRRPIDDLPKLMLCFTSAIGRPSAAVRPFRVDAMLQFGDVFGSGLTIWYYVPSCCGGTILVRLQIGIIMFIIDSSDNNYSSHCSSITRLQNLITSNWSTWSVSMVFTMLLTMIAMLLRFLLTVADQHFFGNTKIGWTVRFSKRRRSSQTSITVCESFLAFVAMTTADWY